MKERPILFSGDMVKALLAGRKTQTRRIVTPAHLYTSMPVEEVFANMTPKHRDMAIDWCRYGRAGDRLWVKETHRHPSKVNPRVRVEYRADMSSWGICDSHDIVTNTVIADAKVYPGPANECSKQHWRPSIFMHRWASRITLEITSVRVERLQDISEEDATAEGIERIPNVGPMRAFGWKDYAGGHGFFDPRDSFRSLWDLINKNWEENPWTWVIKFKRV